MVAYSILEMFLNEPAWNGFPLLMASVSNNPIVDSARTLMLLYLSSSDFKDCGLGFDEVINLADHVAFETADDVAFGFSFSCSACDIGDRGFVETHADDDGSINRCVKLPVPVMVDSVFPAGHP